MFRVYKNKNITVPEFLTIQISLFLLVKYMFFSGICEKKFHLRDQWSVKSVRQGIPCVKSHLSKVISVHFELSYNLERS